MHDRDTKGAHGAGPLFRLGRRGWAAICLGVAGVLLFTSALAVVSAVALRPDSDSRMCLSTWDPRVLSDVAPESLVAADFSLTPYGLVCEWRDRDGQRVVVDHRSQASTVGYLVISPLAAAGLIGIAAQRLSRFPEKGRRSR